MNTKHILEVVLKELEENRYAEGTIAMYKKASYQLGRYLHEQGEDDYSPLLGERFLEYKEQSLKPRSLEVYSTIVNRFNDAFNNTEFKKKHARLPNIQPPEVFAELHKAYVDYRAGLDLNKKTVEHSARYSADFLKELVNRNCLLVSEITPETLFEIMADKSENVRYTVRDLLKFLHRNGYMSWDLSVFVGSKIKMHKLPDFYTKGEQLQILESGSNNKTSPKRNKAIILVATRYGFRDIDISNLKLSDVDFVGNRISLVQEKTDVPVNFPLYENVKEALLDYIENERPDCGIDYVFVTTMAPYSKLEAVYHVFNGSMKAAKVEAKGRTMGSKAIGRASLATAMVNNGMSYEKTRKALGQDCETAIRSYASQDVESLRVCAIDVEPPGGSFKSILEGREKL